MRVRCKFDARQEFETSAALTVRLGRPMSDPNIAAPAEELRRVIIWTGAASISFEQFENHHHTGLIYKDLLEARCRAIQVPRHASIEYKQ